MNDEQNLNNIFKAAQTGDNALNAPDLKRLARINLEQNMLIDFFATKYTAQKHGKLWFEQSFNSDLLDIGELYDNYQANKANLKDKSPLFSVYLFNKLGEQARDLVASLPKDRREAFSAIQEQISLYFTGARAHGHMQALLNSHGTQHKQAAHLKNSAKALKDNLDKMDADETHALERMGHPIANFSLPFTLENHFEKCEEFLETPTANPSLDA